MLRSKKYNMEVRLQKHLADLGYCSRRKAEVFIQAGKVKVNGKVVTTLGTKVDPKKDKVTITTKDKFVATNPNEKIYIALHKPVDFISSSSSEQGSSVLELLTTGNQLGKYKKKLSARVYPVGRLDKDSEGLLLLTNDGELTNKLTHPKFQHQKEYEVTLDKSLSKDAKKVLESGMKIGDGEFVQGIRIKREKKIGRKVIINVVLKEGKNRQIRKMFGRLGYDLLKLKRIRIGDLKLGTLPVGRWRYVKKDFII
jgi:23S rRNA pseudouridine2605 synthase